MKTYLDFYPCRIAKENDFVRHTKNKESFQDFCLGKDEWFYKDEGNYGYERNTKNFTDNQKLDREYLWGEFNLWNTWIKSGRNIFDFSEDILTLLKHTDVSQVELEFIKIPYSFFYLDLSAAKIPFAGDCAALVEGVYVSEYFNEMQDEDVTYERCISFSFTGDYINYFKNINGNIYNHLRGFHTYELALDKPEKLTSVGDAVKYAKDIFVIGGTWDNQEADTKIDLYKIHSDFIERTIKLVVNSLLYLTLTDKDIKEDFPADLPSNLKAKLSKAKTKHQKEVALNEIWISGFTKIKYVGNTFKRSHYSTFATSTVSPHWRRGHWRNQKFGEGLKEHKLIWIVPTIVNKEKGDPKQGHIYETQ